MDYGDLLTRAWKITWYNKFMLVLGFLAALGSTFGNNFNFSFDVQDLPPGFEERIEPFILQLLPILAGLICLGLILTIILWLLRLTAQASLISAASSLDAGEKASFSESFSAGLSKLGRMVGISLLLYGPFMIVVIALVGIASLLGAVAIGSAVASEISGGTEGVLGAVLGSLAIITVCIGLLFCILLPLWLVITVIYPFAQRGAVLQDLGVIASISQAWQMIKSNLGDVVVLLLLFLVITIVFGFFVAIIMFPLAFLAFLPVLIDVITTGNLGASDIFLMLCGGLLLAVIVALLNAILVAFRSTTITLAYQHFLEKTA